MSRGKFEHDFLLWVTHEVAVSFKSGRKMGPVGSARRSVIRSERPLRSILAWAETRDAESISSIYEHEEDQEWEMMDRWQQNAN
jgi:hypothetical protein